MQWQIADHPRSNVFTADKDTILLSHHAVRIGKADLALGHAADAAKQFETALEYRKRWKTAMSNSAEARSYLAEAYLLAGVAAWQGGDMDKGIAHIRECVERCEALAKEHSGYVPFEADVADCSGQLGDVLLRAGKSDAATKAYRRAQQMMDAVLTARPDDPQWQPLLALQYERLGGDALQHGRRDEAARQFAKALKIREDLMLLEPNNRIWQAAYIVALARAGKRSEALQQAHALESKVHGSAELLLQLARCHAICAAVATTPAEKEKQAKAALSLLKAAADMGYRDVTVWQTDPDLIAVRKLPAFTALLDKTS